MTEKRLRKFKPSPRRYCFRCGKECINTKGATSRAFVRVMFTWPYMKETAPLDTDSRTILEINERAYIICRVCMGKNLFFPDRERYHTIMDFHPLTGEPVDLWGGVAYDTAIYKFDATRPWTVDQ